MPTDYDIYPLTILGDRYRGTYSGGQYTAWNLYPNDIPCGPMDNDLNCATFWRICQFPVGKGDTPCEAIKDLMKQLREQK